MSKTFQQIYAQRQRAFRHCCGARNVLARLAHPATGGDECCVLNWGNPEAQRQFFRAQARWARYAAASDLAYAAAMHREHEAEGRVGAYTWCEHCKSANRSVVA